MRYVVITSTGRADTPGTSPSFRSGIFSTAPATPWTVVEAGGAPLLAGQETSLAGDGGWSLLESGIYVVNAHLPVTVELPNPSADSITARLDRRIIIPTGGLGV